MIKRRSKAIAKRTIRRPSSAGISRSRIMSIHRAQVKKHQTRQAPAVISQVTTIIGTDNSWFNAQIIPRDPAWVQVNNASYVWFSGNLSSDNVVISRRFNLSQRRNIRSARLFLSVDNYAVVVINGTPVVYDGPTNQTSNFNPGRSFNIRQFLRRGRNDIVIIAFNFGGPRSANNPAGVAARLNIRLSALQ